MPLRIGAQVAPGGKGQRTSSSVSGRAFAVAMAFMLAVVVVGLGGTASTVRAAGKPKAVIIVGPSSTSTSHFLDDGEIMARQAENAGMDVTRIFHPHATWEKVLNKIQGANFVVYMGHGNGWPSPYAPYQERTKDGFGLNGYDGASKYSVTYYGGNQIREKIQLAKNAVVALVHLCYASGNGEPGMAIPGWSVAKQRVDNYAAAFLDVGARSVFALGWMPEFSLPKLLMDTNQTMDEIFHTNAAGIYPYGWIGWDDRYFDSERTPGGRMHLDPHPSYGFYRALTGDMKLTAGEFRGGGGGDGDGGGGGGGGGDGDSTGTTSGVAPSITSLSVVSTDGSTASALTTTSTSSGTLPTFSPNGDTRHDKVVMSHTLSEAAYLDVKVTNSGGSIVRKFTVYAPQGSSTSAWGGKNGSGNYVQDGIYTLSYRPRDTAGNVGTAKSVKVLVLTSVALFAPLPGAIFSRDLDDLAQKTEVPVRLNQTATVSVKVVNNAGSNIRTVQAATKMTAGTYGFTWNGKDGSGNYVPAGTYRVIVTGQTAAGTYSEQVSLWVGAFRLDASTLTPRRGSQLTLTVYSTEPLAAPPTIDLTQPGLATYTVSTSKVAPLKYKVTVTLKSGGDAGTMRIVVHGTDTGGQAQRLNTSVSLR